MERNNEPVKQEPVAKVTDVFPTRVEWLREVAVNSLLYAAPVSAKREWVELTDDEEYELAKQSAGGSRHWYRLQGEEQVNDKELLELAAKAAGYEKDVDGCYFESGFPTMISWNPLTDDGDALRLAVKLDLFIMNRDDLADAFSLEYSEGSLVGDNCANYRRAIVRAAAEIGRAIK